MQNSPFSALVVAVAIASTCYAYARRDGQAELAWVTELNTKMYTRKPSPITVLINVQQLRSSRPVC